MNLESQMLQNLSTTVCVVDSGLRLIDINAAGERMFATSARNIRGQTLANLLPHSPAFIASLRRVIEAGAPHTEREIQIDIGESRTLVADCVMTPMAEPDNATRWLLEILDVETRVRRMREDNLESAHVMTCSLLRGLAHEIRNPLGGLRGAAQLLERELPDPSLKEYTNIIIAEADRLTNILDSMLQPTEMPAAVEVNLHEAIEHVVRVIESEAPAGVKIVRDYDPSFPAAVGDREQIIQALMNIIRNALQAIDGNGQITVRSRTESRMTIGTRIHRLVARIDIIDDGPGIPEELAGQVFYPMITGRADGTGLGLPIAQAIIRHHEGLVEFFSEPGNTVFTVWLPLETSS